MHFSDKTYNLLKWVALIVLPGLGALYSALAELWGLPFPDEIPGTIMAIDFFLGALIGVSTAEYNRGLK